MIRNLSVTVVIDDNPGNPGLLNEHGLSLWIKADDRCILFDTGQSDSLVHNAGVLGIDLAEADSIVLSHGHYDHTGGLAAVLIINKTAGIYCHPDVVVPRYSRRPDKSLKSIQMPSVSSSILEQSDKVHWISQPEQMNESIGLTGFVPRETPFEDTGGEFFLDLEAKRPDPIADDQSIWFLTEKGVVVVTGCCHAGIVNTINHVARLVPGKKVYALLGGLHLLSASQDRLARTGDFFRRIGLNLIMPCHCTGQEATSAIRSMNSLSFLSGFTGSVLRIV